MASAARRVRSQAIWTLLMFKLLIRFRFFIILAVVQPLFFLTVAALLSSSDAADHDAVLAQAVAGTTVMGMWSATLFGAGRALLRERRAGTMEFWLVSPQPLLAPLLAVCLSAAVMGIVSAGSAVVTAAVVYDFQVSAGELGLFTVGLLLGVVGLAMLGVLMAGVFVLVRQAAMLTNMLEYPVWYVCALVVPSASRPAVVGAIGAVLSPTYVGQLLRAALVDNELDTTAAGKLLALSALYLALALPFLRRVGQIVRRKGDLALV